MHGYQIVLAAMTLTKHYKSANTMTTTICFLSCHRFSNHSAGQYNWCRS